MNGSEWLAALPDAPGAERDQKTLDAVTSGLAHCNWAPITSTIPGHSAVFQVCDDAVWVDLDDGSRFRVQVSATLAQKCADAMGCSLITAKVSDLAYKQAAVVLNASPMGGDPAMVTTTRSKSFNVAVEKKRAGKEGLVRDCGKAWILSNRLGGMHDGAVNYGFYDLHAPYMNPHGIKMWQTLGTRHNRFHTDYSQTLFVTQSQCTVNGQTMAVADVMQSVDLCGLISDEGILHFIRQPGV